MPHEELSREPLPAFVRLRTTKDLIKVAENLAVASKAIDTVARIERKLLAGKVTRSEFELAMSETADFAEMVADKAEETAKLLKDTRAKVKAYKRKLEAYV